MMAPGHSIQATRCRNAQETEKFISYQAALIAQTQTGTDPTHSIVTATKSARQEQLLRTTMPALPAQKTTPTPTMMIAITVARQEQSARAAMATDAGPARQAIALAIINA
jgi:hypothetical protein